MFQTFDQTADPAAAEFRVRRIRALMIHNKLDAYLVPRADEHQGEYVPESAERLRWLTGFSGSAGLAIIGKDVAALIVDGRYTVQVRNEVDAYQFELPDVTRPRIAEWLAKKMPARAVIGFDPSLHTAGEVARLGAALATSGMKLKAVRRANLVDVAWGPSRPALTDAPVFLQPLEYTGRTAADKIAEVQALLKREGQAATVLTLTDSVSWMFNIRSSDVAHTPVVRAFAIVPKKGKAALFLADRRVSDEARAALASVATLWPPLKLRAKLIELRKAKARVRLDPETAPQCFFTALGAENIVRAADPCLALKARKTDAEISGARAAHLRDGAAMVRFLAWLDHEAPKGRLDEIAVVETLEGFRRETGLLRDISFDTIAGSGPNGAIVHYRVSRATNRKIKSGELLLIDSGGQYPDGTTDITRTVAIGKVSDECRERFTLVLKGHIAIATARFPKGTRGIDLDPFARRALWEKGLDYDHGTGHGVGSFLSVHEGPQSISRAGMAALDAGMICSNEPGYYKEGHYGIRIENLVLVTAAESVPGGDRPIHGFETLTLAPLDKRLIAKRLLTTPEVGWLNAYHARVQAEVGPEVDPDTRAWLAKATDPL